jgi:hypothetical protein
MDNAQFNLQRVRMYAYDLDMQTGTYHIKPGTINPHRLPEIFKEEPPQQLRGDIIIRGRSGTWDKRLLTGLIRFRTNWYYGDTLLKGRKSLLVFRYSEDRFSVQVYLSPGMYPHGSLRDHVLQSLSNSVLTREGK